jgi:hypothetical protein
MRCYVWGNKWLILSLNAFINAGVPGSKGAVCCAPYCRAPLPSAPPTALAGGSETRPYIIESGRGRTGPAREWWVIYTSKSTPLSIGKNTGTLMCESR